MQSSTLLLIEYTGFVVLLVLVPLLPVFMAAREKADYEPLPVNLEYTKDPRAIARYFDTYFSDSFDENSLMVGDRVNSKKLGTLYVLGETFAHEVYRDMVYFIGRVKIPENLKFEREMISRDILEVGDGCHARAIKAEKKLVLGKECCVTRWIDAEGPIEVGEGSHINIAGSSSIIHLSKDATFNRLYGHPVLTSHAFTFHKDPDHFREEHLDDAHIEENLLYIQEEEHTLEQGSRLFRSLVTQGDLVLEEGVKVFGSIKVNGNVVLAENCFVDGNIIAEGFIVIGENAFVTGDLFSREYIEIGSYTQIGTSEHTKSVVAQKEIKLAEHVAIFNYVLTDLGGKVTESL